jgi:3-dehydroquinate synthetase
MSQPHKVSACSRSTAIVENGGGILRNISSFIATCSQGEEYRYQELFC